MVAQEAAQVTILELEKFGEKSELASFSRFLRQEIGVKVNQVEVLEGWFWRYEFDFYELIRARSDRPNMILQRFVSTV